MIKELKHDDAQGKGSVVGIIRLRSLFMAPRIWKCWTLWLRSQNPVPAAMAARGSAFSARLALARLPPYLAGEYTWLWQHLTSQLLAAKE